MSAQTTFTQFGPDPPFASLPEAFQKCLPPNAQTVTTDGVIGSLASGQGYCSQTTPDPRYPGSAPYAQSTYCACVNNAIPCPMVAAAACANSAFAYLPTRMTPPSGSAYAVCKDRPICINIVEVGGNQNIVSGITQQCGVIQNIQNVIQTSPTLAALAFLLFITLVVLLSMRTGTGGRRATPPPPLGLGLPGGFGDMPGPPGFPL
jgi:hypothetical protein